MQALADEESAQFHLDASQAIVYCDISPSFDRQHIQHTLQDGSAVGFHWHIIISSIRPYWFNKKVADITFYRQITPDLISRQWLLEDSITGISAHTSALDQAIFFVSNITQFPLIDKSLLETHTSYIIQVNLNITGGSGEQAWWDGMVSFENTIATALFTLP